MKLENDLIGYLKNVLKLAQMVGIDNVIVENGLVRALDDAQTVVMIQSEDVPVMPFEAIGFNRINILLSRMSLVEGGDGFIIDADLDNDIVAKLTLKSKGSKVEYRCANPSTIRAPKAMRDVFKFRATLNNDAVTLLQKAANAMPQNSEVEVMTIISDGDKVSFELSDATNDCFSHTFSDVTCLDDEESGKFANRYPLKTAISLFKNCPEATFEVGQKGILKLGVNGIDIFILPQV